MNRLFKKHKFFTICLVIVNSIFCGMFFQERSFGGDFWLHLWLIEIQKQSFSDFGLPALFASFQPAGALSTAPLFTGGFLYSIAGLISALGLSTYWSAIILALLAFNSAFICVYGLLQIFDLQTYLRVSLAFIPLAFAFPVGDGFGRGGLSSMVAGLFGIAAVSLLLKSLLSTKKAKQNLILCATAVFFATSTHLPSAIIFGVFSIPLIIIACFFWKDKITKQGIFFSIGATSLGLLLSCIYLIPTLTWAIQASNQATQIEPFQLGASQYYADPYYQWNLLRLIPPGHIEFWKDQTSDGSSTSLITTLPTLLYIAAIVGALFSVKNTEFKKILAPLVPLIVSTSLLIIPIIWTVFPYPLRSLQYSFRISYTIIPWLIVSLAVVLASIQRPKWKNILSIWTLCSIIICCGQTFIQLGSTTNLSILPTGDPLKRFVRDVPPKEMLTKSSPEFFWYSAGEQKAVDEKVENIDATGCTFFNSVEQWPSFPAVNRVIIPKDFSCAYFSMNLPVSWLYFKNASVIGRDPDTLNLIIRSENESMEMVVGIRILTPISLGILLSSIGFMLILFIQIFDRLSLKSKKHQPEKNLNIS